MSIAACPSIEPATARSACRRASSTSRGVRKLRSNRARTTIITGPPTNSAAVNCQPSSSPRMRPSSITRFVEANWNAIAEVKLAPLRNSDRAMATAAYEHDDDAAPRMVAVARLRGWSSGSSRAIVALATSASIIAESVKPRINDQVTCHVIDPVIDRAWPRACSSRSMVQEPIPPRGIASQGAITARAPGSTTGRPRPLCPSPAG